jgi:hypothetical protein
MNPLVDNWPVCAIRLAHVRPFRSRLGRRSDHFCNRWLIERQFVAAAGTSWLASDAAADEVGLPADVGKAVGDEGLTAAFGVVLGGRGRRQRGSTVPVPAVTGSLPQLPGASGIQCDTVIAIGVTPVHQLLQLGRHSANGDAALVDEVLSVPVFRHRRFPSAGSERQRGPMWMP